MQSDVCLAVLRGWPLNARKDISVRFPLIAGVQFIFIALHSVPGNAVNGLDRAHLLSRVKMYEAKHLSLYKATLSHSKHIHRCSRHGTAQQ